ncbi:MAG TPA: peptidylprolyl isomerase [Pseudolabrys sp.]|jgi:peptidyl-prolyl cis-trans isomerase C|nr:peptidylprolyl isomerase [Pseudolabrys sp.]
MSCSVHVQFPAGKPVTVSVNGVAIARDAIQREMQHHPAEKPIAAWQQAARALVIRELLLQRAKHLSLVPEPMSDEAGRRETDDEALMRAVVEREVTVPTPDDATCRRYYEQNSARFRSPDIYEASHILFAALPADREGYAAARADAAAVLATIQDDPSSFAALAKAHSKCSSAELGGNLGQITTGQTTPEFERALVALAPGELCAEPVATRYGFHIVRLARKTEGRVVPYEAVAEHIADYLRESVQRRANSQYVARLASAARIEGVELASAEALRVH